MTTSNFQFSGLPAEPFAGLFSLDAAALARRRMRRITVPGPGHLCRVSLEDVPVGQDLLLLGYEHHAADTPYRAAGPIFVGEGARRARLAPGQVPAAMRDNIYSIRAYSAKGDIVDAEVSRGRDLEVPILRLLGVPGAAWLHVHHARYGCYACRVDPAP